MVYFTYVGMEYAAKNKLQDAVQKFILSKNRMVVDSSKVPAYKAEIIKHIGELNKQFTRCTPLKPDFWQPPKIGDHQSHDFILSFSGESVIHFSLYASQEHYDLNSQS